MYERSAIVLERYFNNILGYFSENNLKVNFENYCSLVEKLDKFQQCYLQELIAIQEFEDVTDRLKTIQKTQEKLYKKGVKLEFNRNILFNNIEENPESIEHCMIKIENDIDRNVESLKELRVNFINILNEYNEKNIVLTKNKKGKKESEKLYKEILEVSQDNIDNINEFVLEVARNFNGVEIKEKLLKLMIDNGKEEKIPFDEEVISLAVDLGMDIEQKEVQCYIDAYDSILKLFVEIDKDEIKIEKFKRKLKNAKVILHFLEATKEYLVQFLDYERMMSVSGKRTHKKLMEQACENFKLDVMQINNLYELILKEMANKSTQKMYKELYNKSYLLEINREEESLKKEKNKVNSAVATVLGSNYWRIEGIKNIYTVFYKEVSETFGRDLDEFDVPDDEENELEIFEEETMKISNFDSHIQKENTKFIEEIEEDELPQLISEAEDDELPQIILESEIELPKFVSKPEKDKVLQVILEQEKEESSQVELEQNEDTEPEIFAETIIKEAKIIKENKEKSKKILEDFEDSEEESFSIVESAKAKKKDKVLNTQNIKEIKKEIAPIIEEVKPKLKANVSIIDELDVENDEKIVQKTKENKEPKATIKSEIEVKLEEKIATIKELEEKQKQKLASIIKELETKVEEKPTIIEEIETKKKRKDIIREEEEEKKKEKAKLKEEEQEKKREQAKLKEEEQEKKREQAKLKEEARKKKNENIEIIEQVKPEAENKEFVEEVKTKRRRKDIIREEEEEKKKEKAKLKESAKRGKRAKTQIIEKIEETALEDEIITKEQYIEEDVVEEPISSIKDFENVVDSNAELFDDEISSIQEIEENIQDDDQEYEIEEEESLFGNIKNTKQGRRANLDLEILEQLEEKNKSSKKGIFSSLMKMNSKKGKRVAE